MNTKILQNGLIFHDMTVEDIEAALSSLNQEEKFYHKGEIILHAGCITQKIGFVRDGSVTVESNDIWGNRSILSHVGKNHFKIF